MAKYSVQVIPPTDIRHNAELVPPSQEDAGGAAGRPRFSLNARDIAHGLKEQRREFKKEGLRANFETFVEAQFYMRRQILDILLDPRHKIDQECGYPPDITPQMYKAMFERSEVARRVVELMPKESWKTVPEVFETHDPDDDTPFEQAFEALVKRLCLWSVMKRADILSGIGRFGVLLLGLNDGRDMSEPVDGIDDTGEKYGDFKHDLIFLRVFDETVVRVNMRESNTNNPRFGKPTIYTVTFKDFDITELAGSGIATTGDLTKRVHWSRIIHLADNREMSDIYGCPRQKPVFNRLMDCRKVLGGSAEMFWKGAFPGISFELMPGIGDAELDQAALQQQMAQYSGGLQRYIALTGMTAKSLAPVVADPEKHLDKQLQFICLSLGCPTRVFQGSEEAKLASSTDAKTWNGRVMERRGDYLTPFVIRPLVDRLITVGVLPEPEEYEVHWDDLNTATDGEKATIALQKSQALAAYVSGGVSAIMSPADFLETVMELDRDKIEELMKAVDVEAAIDMEDDEEDEAGAASKGKGSQQPKDDATRNRHSHKVSVRVLGTTRNWTEEAWKASAESRKKAAKSKSSKKSDKIDLSQHDKYLLVKGNGDIYSSHRTKDAVEEAAQGHHDLSGKSPVEVIPKSDYAQSEHGHRLAENSAAGAGNEKEQDAFEDGAARQGGASLPEKKPAKGPKKSGAYRDKYKAAKPPNKKSGGPGIAPSVTSMLEEASADQATKP